MKYFFDESGHGGDLIKAAGKYDFSGQPIFVLACVGLPSDGCMDGEVARIKARHNSSAGELKSDSLTKRPQMALDIVQALQHQNARVIIEVVDKRFFICMNIVSFMLLPFAGRAERDPRLTYFRNEFAEYLFEELPDPNLDLFLAACSSPSNKAVADCLEGFQTVLNQSARRSEVADAIALVARNRLEELDSESSMDAWIDFLPPPDKNKHGKSVWLLPNLPSLMNAYGRINLAHQGKIEGLQLLHDEQAQFDDLLNDYKSLAEGITDYIALPFTPNSDFRFLERANLQFGASHEHIGIQRADTVAGFVMRFTKGEGGYRRTHSEAFQSLLRMTDARNGLGINFVMPSRVIQALGVMIN